MFELRRQQRWFLDAVRAPTSDRRQKAANQRLVAGTRAGADGLAVYQEAYHARLFGCVREDFPGVEAVLGEAAFAALLRAGIAANPPPSAVNLNHYGAWFPAWVGNHAPRAVRGFVRDLAALEWALMTVIHRPLAPAPDNQRIAASALAEVAPERLAGARFDLTPALVLLKLAYQVNPWFEAFRTGTTGPRPVRAATYVAVLRRADGLHRVDLDRAEFALLAALQSGQEFAVALDAVGRRHPLTAADLQRWCARWVASGLLHGLRLTP